MGVIARATDASDAELVACVRAGDDCAFEELYRRYSRRVAGFVCRMVGDPDRAEDVTQEAFFSALRRLRQTETDIVFKPWVFEIAKNAAIDHFRRVSRAEEVSLQAEDGSLRPADHLRLVGVDPVPEVAFEGKERLDHLRGAFDELSDSHSRILVLRELEGLSYREIGERMEMSRPAVESTLFRARRRLNEEYADLDTGARCLAVTAAIARLAEGIDSARDRRRVSRHAFRCSSCRRHAREMGVAVEAPVRSRVAAFLPLPALARRRRGDSHEGGAGAAAGNGYAAGVERVAGWAPAVVTTGAAEGTAQAWSKALAVVAAVALAGGGAAVHENVIDADRGAPAQVVPAQQQGGDAGVPGGPAHGDGGAGGLRSDGPGGPGQGRDQSGGGDATSGVRMPEFDGRPGAPSPQVGVPNVTPPSADTPGTPGTPGIPAAPPVDAGDPTHAFPPLSLDSGQPDRPAPPSLLEELNGEGAPAIPSFPASGQVSAPEAPAQRAAPDVVGTVEQSLPAAPELALPEG